MPYLCLWRRNFCAAGGVLLWLQRCDFRMNKKPFLLTTAAQNIYVFLRKSPLFKEHFFEWLKTENSSTACGTVTLKSLLLLGSNAPHVHLRLRKRFSRCTLDCGFKTSESPALRGFEAERAPIRGTSLYLVLKSNGLHRPKIRLKKFSFFAHRHSHKYRQKVISITLFQTVSHRIFQLLSQMAHIRFRSRKRVHTRLSEKNRTQGHTRRNRGLPDGAAITTLDTYCTFTNIPGPGTRTAYFAALGSWPGGALEERRKPAGQRCAYARRCPEASRPRWAA